MRVEQNRQVIMGLELTVNPALVGIQIGLAQWARGDYTLSVIL